MFMPVTQQYDLAFVQHPILREHATAFSRMSPKLSWGNLQFSDDSAIALKKRPVWC